jgi:hypothetical protein
MSPLILPGDPEFAITLGTALPPATPDAVFIVRPGSLLMEPVSADEATEYLNSGEYDDRLLELDDDATAAGFNDEYSVEFGW